MVLPDYELIKKFTPSMATSERVVSLQCSIYFLLAPKNVKVQERNTFPEVEMLNHLKIQKVQEDIYTYTTPGVPLRLFKLFVILEITIQSNEFHHGVLIYIHWCMLFSYGVLPYSPPLVVPYSSLWLHSFPS